ncbi:MULTISPECIES: 3-dehydroquinate synthase II family protein [unclassified Streptomyces]|uniref:3-dehydroquinate synthase II family protein n=1 Tax=unclassified Streptomyces TaxID=2593676 RepID=UPI00382E57F4
MDVRDCPPDRLTAFLDAAVHHRVDGIVAADTEILAPLPPTVRKVLFPQRSDAVAPEGSDVDVVVTAARAEMPRLTAELGHFVDVRDATSLDEACRRASTEPWTVLSFADPTKIPLEIVIAAANNADGHTVTVVHDLEEAAVVFGCLERGSDGIVMKPRSLEDITALAELRTERVEQVPLSELSVESITHVGMGDRACLDTCSMLMEDEGLLIGSFAGGLVLTCSETHPLPYMPTRPFRINAGAVHSYTLATATRTNYLSELRAGAELIAVRADGRARRVVLGRVKIERRPLLSILATGPDGQSCNIIVQDDWHVRLLGPHGKVLNVTELKPGDTLLGFLPTEARHVGLPVDEFCIER